jgi:AraC-like DNA-binding protein
MELVRGASLSGYFAVAEQLRLDVAPLLRRSGLTRAMVNNPELMLPARSVVQLLEESAQASECATFALRMAELREISHLGLISLLIVHQPTLGDALDVLSEYRNRINSNLSLQAEDHEDTIFLREHFALDPPLYSRQVSDLALGVLYKLCRSVTIDSWRPLCVSFSYERPSPSDRPLYDRLFDCPIQFGSDFDGLVIEKADLGRRNPLSDMALASHARELIARMISPENRTVAEEVEQSIRILMPAGRASIGEVAHALGTNVRTLQRRLEREDVAFSDLLDRVRVQQVSQHFASRHLRLTDVAHLLGYSTLASFSNWYRSRFNRTPSAGRRATQRANGAEA